MSHHHHHHLHHHHHHQQHNHNGRHEIVANNLPPILQQEQQYSLSCNDNPIIYHHHPQQFCSPTHNNQIVGPPLLSGEPSSQSITTIDTTTNSLIVDYHSHPPHSHSHFPLVSIPTYCSHSNNNNSSNSGSINNCSSSSINHHSNHIVDENYYHHSTNYSHPMMNMHNHHNHHTGSLVDESLSLHSPQIINNNIPSFNCSSCPTTGSNLAFQQLTPIPPPPPSSSSSLIEEVSTRNSHNTSTTNNNNNINNNNNNIINENNNINHNNKKRKLSMTDIESNNSSSFSNIVTSSSSSSYELESIPTRLFMGECIRVKIREIPGIVDQFRQMFEQHEVKLQNLTVCFQKEGLFNFQLPCLLEGNDCIVFTVPKREVFLPYLQSLSSAEDGCGSSLTLHHCAVTISARNLIPTGGDCFMLLMHQICCSIVCLETSDMINFVSKCFNEPKRLKHLLLTVREKYADDFGAMLHSEDEYPLIEPMKSNLKIVKELGKGSNGFVYLVERRKSSSNSNNNNQTMDWQNAKKLALKQSFSSNPTRVQDYISVHKAMMNISKSEIESNIIQIYEIQSVKIEESNTHVTEILMEKCEYDLGRFCRRYFKSSLTLETLDSLFSIIKQTVNGIRMIHESGYCHLDIKEGNIMLNREKIVKLIDFDFSIASNVSISSKRGTPLYLSPEMVNIKEVSKPIDRSDVWSLGVVILNVVRIMKGLKKFEIASIASKELLVEDDVMILGNAKEQQSIDVIVTKIFDTSSSSSQQQQSLPLDPQVINNMKYLESLVMNMLQISYEKRYSVEDLWNAILKRN